MKSSKALHDGVSVAKETVKTTNIRVDSYPRAHDLYRDDKRHFIYMYST